MSAAAKRRWLLAVLSALLLAGLWLSLLTGPVKTTPGDLFDFVSGRNAANAAIFADIRLSRALLAFLVGAALSLSGAILQGYFQNPMADPFVVGASSGASLGAVVLHLPGDRRHGLRVLEPERLRLRVPGSGSSRSSTLSPGGRTSIAWRRSS